MKATMRTLVGATMALALTGAAQVRADDEDSERRCSVRTLRGSYILSATGFQIAGGVAQPKTIVELVEFNGDGTLTVSGGTLSVNGNVTQIPPGIGDYFIGPDCNGTLKFIPGPNFNLFIERDGKSGLAIQTTPGNVFQGTLTRRK